jgi:hypothetical protein
MQPERVLLHDRAKSRASKLHKLLHEMITAKGGKKAGAAQAFVLPQFATHFRKEPEIIANAQCSDARSAFSLATAKNTQAEAGLFSPMRFTAEQSSEAKETGPTRMLPDTSVVVFH